MIADISIATVQVTKNHFKDIAYICVSGEGTSLQQLLVYTDSMNDKDLLMV